MKKNIKIAMAFVVATMVFGGCSIQQKADTKATDRTAKHDKEAVVTTVEDDTSDETNVDAESNELQKDKEGKDTKKSNIKRMEKLYKSTVEFLEEAEADSNNK